MELPRNFKDKDWVAILDFGSQYTHLIARHIREIGVYSETVPYDTDADDLLAKRPRGIILCSFTNKNGWGNG